MTNTNRWKHPPAVDKPTARQLADIVAYIRYAVTGSRQPWIPRTFSRFRAANVRERFFHAGSPRMRERASPR